MTKKNVTKPTMSESTKRTIIVTAICLVAVIVISIVLAVMLKPTIINPDDNDPNTTPSSNLTIKNGDFAIPRSEDTSYPMGALNWTRYGYKAPEGTSHNFETISTPENVVMGIVDTSEEKWNQVLEDIAVESITGVTNPGTPNSGTQNDNVYMIAAKDKYSASIISDSFSIPATTSSKITVWLNTYQLEEGSTATIMIQKYTTTPNALEENRYAYKFEIPKSATDEWIAYEFHVFNRQTTSQSVRCSVGIGNVYEADMEAGGVLFIDDIEYEAVTANDYREYVDAIDIDPEDKSYYAITKEDKTDTKVPEYVTFTAQNGINVEWLETAEDYLGQAVVDGKEYSPFTILEDYNRDGQPSGFGIYKLTNDGTIRAPQVLALTNSISLQITPNTQDHHHISFWVRTVSDKNALAKAKVYVQSKSETDADYKTLSNGKIIVETNQDIVTDTNNGWTKYDIYLKPAYTGNDIRILVSLGDVDGYAHENAHYIPKGSLYVTTPAHETISADAYESASSGTYVKTYNLIGAVASTITSNGSFSTHTSSTENQPTSWAPVFAGENAIYKDGQGDRIPTDVRTDVNAIAGSGIVFDCSFASSTDDAAKNVLQITTNGTSFGYISNNITLTKNTVYAISVIAKVENGQKPYIYLIDNDKARDNGAIIASVTETYDPAATTQVDNTLFGDPTNEQMGNGWVRYYMIVVAGATTRERVRIALFNGSIDGTTANSTVYYDDVKVTTLGTYTLDTDTENKDAKEYVVNWKANTGFTDLFDKIDEDTDRFGDIGVTVVEPTDAEWTEMKTIPEESKTEEPTTPATKRDVDLGLLFSILSSVILVAALAVVIVIRVFKKRNSNK